jgi:PKD repeat protein
MYKTGKKHILFLVLLAIMAFELLSWQGFITTGSPGLTLNVATDKQTYVLRQKVAINGSITLDGSPATNLVVAQQVKNPEPYPPYSFRTLSLGNPGGPWSVNITSITIKDASSNPIDTIKAGSQMKVSMRVDNLQGNSAYIFATVTVYDANMASIGTYMWTASIDPMQSSASTFQIDVPKSAVSGCAQIAGCVYSNEPASGGVPHCPERIFYYCISRTQTGLFGLAQFPQPPPQSTPGIIDASIRLPPTPRAGQYAVYMLAQSSPGIYSSATTSFQVQNANGVPPQASFAYWPIAPTVNNTVDFDASSSTPEGYNDIITKYEWNWGDGTPNTIKTGSPANPTASHVFTQVTSYTVTLNVTDNEGLWCTTSKRVTIGLGYGPTANFTWLPTSVLVNETATFDASQSTPGDYSTLVNYVWNFSDGTGIFNVSTPQTTHTFTQPANYTVTLTVWDSVNRSSSISKTVAVLNFTLAIYDLNHNGRIDGTDIAIVSWSFGSYGPDYLYPGSPPHPRWNPEADFLGQNRITGTHIALVAHNFGKVV